MPDVPFPSLRAALLDALAVLLPVGCAGCGAPDRAVCLLCAAALVEPSSESMTPQGLRVRSALRYQGIARELLLALKEQSRTDVATSLAGRLAPLLPAGLPLVAVPSAPSAYRRRGYDPLRLLLPRRCLPALEVVRAGVAQKTLGVGERAANRTGSLRATRSLVGLRVVIADDIVTTGATLDEAARAIRAAGGQVDHAVTLAATPRYSENRTENPERSRASRDIPGARVYGGAKGARSGPPDRGPGADQAGRSSWRSPLPDAT